MKRIALVLICVVDLFASLPCFATTGAPPADSKTVTSTLPLGAPVPAPLPVWLAPQGSQPSAAPASTSIDKLFTRTGLGRTT